MKAGDHSFDPATFEKAVAWFVALQDDNCDDHQRTRFQHWLARHPSHRLAYEEAEKLWLNLDQIKAETVPGLDAARSLRPRRWAGARNGMALILLAAVSLGWWLDYSAETQVYATAVGQRQGIDLADGSHVELNAATQLAVRISWLRREVALRDGEAMFDVVHQRFRPFSVLAGDLQIRDIGTRFDVRKRPEATVVSVLDGEVELVRDGKTVDAGLKAGFSRRFDRHGRALPVEAIDAERASAWIDGRLVFEHTPLAEVAAELERYHPVGFVFADPDVADETLSGTFESADLGPFLRALEKILPLRVERRKQTIVLHRR